MRRARVTGLGLALAALACAAPLRAETGGGDLVVHAPERADRRGFSATPKAMVLRIPLPDRSVWRPVVREAARSNGLPEDFLDRVLWRESMYFPLAQSRVGAQGIAQFMPGTAQDRGVGDPYNPAHAIPAAARYLRDLKARFGSLSLAAAAYNGGPQKVSRWLSGSAELPRETVDYVRAVTGEQLAPSRSEVGVAPAGGIAHPSVGAASSRLKRAKLSPEADLCAKLSTAERPCLVQATY